MRAADSGQAERVSRAMDDMNTNNAVKHSVVYPEEGVYTNFPEARFALLELFYAGHDDIHEFSTASRAISKWFDELR